MRHLDIPGAFAEVIWHDPIPDEIRNAAAPLVRKYLPWLPPWVTKLHVEWDDADAVISCKFNEGYGRAQLLIHPGWLDSFEGREADVAHEVAHMWLGIDHAFLHSLIDELPDVLRQFARKRFDKEIERQADYLSRLIYRAANQDPSFTATVEYVENDPLLGGS